MDNEIKKTKVTARQYPALYEKMVPLAIVLIVVVTLILLVISFGIAMGMWANPVLQ